VGADGASAVGYARTRARSEQGFPYDWAKTGSPYTLWYSPKADVYRVSPALSAMGSGHPESKGAFDFSPHLPPWPQIRERQGPHGK
jgi:hypothetical protein